MKCLLLFLCSICLAATAVAGTPMAQTQPTTQAARLALPPAGRLYHGLYPGGESGDEDDILAADVDAYEALAGKKVAWVYFSHNWFHGRAFPAETAAWIRERGAIPYIRLMLRSRNKNTPKAAGREETYKLKNILEGRFDQDLRAWARAARDFGTPCLVEYGTEMNGEWFPWNGRWNGEQSPAEGVKRFAAAYRHIVELMRAEGASNLAWVFHVNDSDSPAAGWNRFENYYPGDDVVDWLGVSVYGYQTPQEKKDAVGSFREALDAAYARLTAMAPSKPVLLLEFGCTAGNANADPGLWAREALGDVLGRRWPKLAGFCWWNEHWENDNNHQHDTTMRLQDIPSLAKVFGDVLESHRSAVQERPVFVRPDSPPR